MVSRTEKKLEESTCGVNIEVVCSSRGGRVSRLSEAILGAQADLTEIR